MQVTLAASSPMRDTVNASKYPRVAAYLASMLRGIDAYPEAQAKVSLITTALELRQPTIDPNDIPAAIYDLLTDPPPVSAWVPEVHFQAAMLLLADAWFPGDDAGFIAWVHRLSWRLFDKPLYRAFFYVLSPDRAVRLVAPRWSTLHRGIVLVDYDSADRELDLELIYPPGSYTELHVHVAAIAIRAYVEASGGANVSLAATKITRTRAFLRGAWH